MQLRFESRRILFAIACALLAGLVVHVPVSRAQSEAGDGPPPLVVFTMPGADEGWSSHSESALSEEGAATLESIRSDPLASDVQIGHSTPGAVLSARALSLTLPSASGEGTDTSFVFASVIVEYSDAGLASVHGHDEETGSEVSVVIDGEDVFGSIQQGDEHYRLRPLGDGLTAVFRFAVNQLREHGPDYPDFIQEQLQENAPPWEPPPGAADTGDVIDVMVVYTPRARISAGNMDLWIQSALDNTGRIYDNTNIGPRLRLVHKYEENYSEGSTIRQDLDRLTFTDGYLEGVHAQRDRYGADLVVLIVERDNMAERLCGWAWINSNPSRGFGVVDEDCEDGHYTFAHEIGHNQGADHDPDNRALNPPAFPYGQGFCNVAENWSTVMSYTANRQGNCRGRIEYFSSPLIRYRGTPTGEAAVRDNRRVLNETARQIANFRQSVEAPGGGTHTLPLIIAHGHSFQQGFVRIINHSDRAGNVEIRAIDDTGRSFGPITLTLEERQTRHFNSDDLERGNSNRLSVGVGNGTGNWRLELESELDIEPLGYIRTDDRFVTSMHDVVAGDQSTGYHVPFFNEGTHLNKSHLRLINTADAEAEVTISALDDNGRASPGGRVRFTLPPGGACRIGADDLESGSTSGRCNRGFSGRLGGGHGKWHLSVTADRPILVMNLMATPTGHLTNLSTSTGREPGIPRPPPPAGPDLVVQSPSVSNSNPGVGESFVFRGTVRNQGNGPSTSTRLRFFRSTDATISTADTEIMTTRPATVSALNPSDSLNFSLTVTLRTSLTVYIGACVTPVPDESDSANNCSTGVRVTVGPPSGGIRWGAIAAGWRDRNQCRVGWNWRLDRPDRNSAESEALSACRNRGLADCTVYSRFTACGSLTAGRSGTTCYLVGEQGANSSQAEQNALLSCNRAGYTGCRILQDGTSGRNATFCNSGSQAPPLAEGQASAVVDSLSGTGEPGSGSQESYDTGEAVEDLLGGIEVEGWTITD